MSTPLRVLTVRDLSRATLARQMLLARQKVGVVTAIERLAALQAQWSPSPYVALWTRLAGFERDELWRAIEKTHTVVRARLMRGTLHLVSAKDFWAYAVATQDLQRGAWNRLQIARGVDPRAVARAAIAFANVPRTKEDVLAHLAERVAKIEGDFSWLIWRFVSAHADLLSAPPGGHWAYGGTDHPYVAAQHWIAAGSRPSEDAALEHLVRRCIAAFGPVTIADIAKFGGQAPPRIRPILERLAPSLRAFRDEQGRPLYDLPRAPRPDADTPAPVRLLPRYDEILIAYQHRDRVVAAKHRLAIYSKNGIIEATLLVDGFVAGTWALARGKEDAVVRVAPFARLRPADRAAALAEGEKLARFLAPEARTHGAKIA
ncbi:MAG TPA: winged helix DNA-binding domain-containing protein [Candidatus Acidoferrales bacterium]|nr:winged helix DNA-binding domain-containing protein [Candidatus Acidoferrales bacterium]